MYISYDQKKSVEEKKKNSHLFRTFWSSYHNNNLNERLAMTSLSKCSQKEIDTTITYGLNKLCTYPRNRKQDFPTNIIIYWFKKISEDAQADLLINLLDMYPFIMRNLYRACSDNTLYEIIAHIDKKMKGRLHLSYREEILENIEYNKKQREIIQWRSIARRRYIQSHQ